MTCTDYMTEHYKQFCNIAKRGVGINQLLQLLRLKSFTPNLSVHPERSVSQTLLLLEELQFGLQMKVGGDEYLCGCVHEVANAMLFKG